MLKLITSSQMRDVDRYTISSKSILSIDLMEKASQTFVNSFIKTETDKNLKIAVICGKGNNGGDGLAIVRLLVNLNYAYVEVFIIDFSTKQTNDFNSNLNALMEIGIKPIFIKNSADFNLIEADIIIDAILGSGLNRSIDKEIEKLVQKINVLNKKVYAVDVPTGFKAEGILPENYNGIKAFKTISFQRPKINFLFPESIKATKHFEFVDIGLDENYIQSLESDFYLIEEIDIVQCLKPREAFSYKGSYGHALIMAGAEETMGASILSASACLYAGVGLLSLSIPSSGLTAVNSVLPEAMYLSREKIIKDDLTKYKAIAIGPGLGNDAEELLKILIDKKLKLVIDADAINALSKNINWINQLTENTIITPHLKEFDILFGTHNNWWSRLETAQGKAKSLKIVIVLKNQYTFICTPNGNILINSTGNPAMAQAGMGDVLTGAITAFVAQGYSSTEACMLACYVHGKAGDTLSKQQYVITASQIAHQINKEIKKVSTI
jgi:hydroxyethylthiazole kinase-like uncharacterized protein yjeF